MLGFNFDKKTLYIVIGILALYRIMIYANEGGGAILALILTLPGLLIAISFHEFAHAYVANKLGDDTPKLQGRLTLNPLAHLDPIGCFLLLFAGFGWGKPVVVNPNNYTRKFSMEKGDALVSIAGPIMNFILAILFTVIYCLITKFGFFGIENLETITIISLIVQYTIMINIGLGVFNLIPLPPLDGSKVIKPFLSYNAKQWFSRNEMIFYVIFIVIWITGIAGSIISPVIGFLNNALLDLGKLIFRI